MTTADAKPATSTTPETASRVRKGQVLRDDVRERQTSHWDLDAMTQAELEDTFARGRDWHPQPQWRRWLRAFLVTFAIFAGLALLNSIVSHLRGLTSL
ncbi:MAG: hypothetical protein ABF296_00975 [Oceanococcaceae bacterium]